MLAGFRGSERGYPARPPRPGVLLPLICPLASLRLGTAELTGDSGLLHVWKVRRRCQIGHFVTSVRARLCVPSQLLHGHRTRPPT